METLEAPVAVIGMASRLAGGIDSPDPLCEVLLRGDDLITEIAAARWDADEYYDPEPGVPGRSASRWDVFPDDVSGFDSESFGISESEATAVDPQHRLLLETSLEATEHAGRRPASRTGSRTCMFMGLTHPDYTLQLADARALDGPYGFTGNNSSLASGRISYSMGRCHAFDVTADGFVPGEGSVVVLERLADAQGDGDRILAVIRGTAVSEVGHAVNIATLRDRNGIRINAAITTVCAVADRLCENLAAEEGVAP